MSRSNMCKTNVYFWGTDDRIVIFDDVISVDVQVFPAERDHFRSLFSPEVDLHLVVRPPEAVIRVEIPRDSDRLPYALGMTAPLLIAHGGDYHAFRRAFLEKCDVTWAVRPRDDGEPWSAWDVVRRPTWTLNWRTVGDPAADLTGVLT